MADNTAQTGADTIATDELSTLNGAASSGVKVQRVKPGFGVDGDYRDVSLLFGLPTAAAQSATGTITSVNLSVTSVTLLAANTARKGAIFFNDSTNWLWLAMAATASLTAFSVEVGPGALFELPGTSVIYTGIVTGIAQVASGAIRITELT